LRKPWHRLRRNADKDDVLLSEILLKKFFRRNYIVLSARDAYARAFFREYKKFAGLPCEEDTDGGLDIKVLGPGRGKDPIRGNPQELAEGSKRQFLRAQQH